MGTAVGLFFTKIPGQLRVQALHSGPSHPKKITELRPDIRTHSDGDPACPSELLHFTCDQKKINTTGPKKDVYSHMELREVRAQLWRRSVAIKGLGNNT